MLQQAHCPRREKGGQAAGGAEQAGAAVRTEDFGRAHREGGRQSCPSDLRH